MQNFKQAGEKIVEWLKAEYTSIRTSRAAPTILDGILVESYGSRMPINQLATVSIEDPKTLRVSPWDKAVAKDIDKAIRESNLGLSVALDANGLRVSFPELTSERRELLVKLAKEKLEEARIKIRNERQKVLNELKELPEDEETRKKNELQKQVDEVNKRLEDLAERKESEITG